MSAFCLRNLKSGEIHPAIHTNPHLHISASAARSAAQIAANVKLFALVVFQEVCWSISVRVHNTMLFAVMANNVLQIHNQCEEDFLLYLFPYFVVIRF